MNQILLQLFLLFGYIALGFVCNRIKLLDEVSDRYFSNFLLKVTLPMSIISSAIGQSSENLVTAYIVLGVAVGIFILLPILAGLFQKITKCDDTYKLMLTYPNLAFMGFPIITALYGQLGLFYASLFLIVFNISVFSYGVSVIQKDKKIQFKNLISPGILSAIVALLIFSFRIPIPEMVSKYLSSVGNITSPLAMITLGSTLATVKFKEILTNKLLYVFSTCKLMIWPVIIWGILQFMIQDKMILGVSTILIGLPVAGNVSMLCISYGGNKKLAVEGTCISTILSLLTIPIFMFLFMR